VPDQPHPPFKGYTHTKVIAAADEREAVMESPIRRTSWVKWLSVNDFQSHLPKVVA
jgi:hypothetical protein